MSRCIDLIGQNFGKLTVLQKSEKSNNGKARWLCKCECGNEKIILGDSLRYGKTISCGCNYFESNKNRNKRHGQTNTRLFRIWSSMKQRCNNPTLYGGKGITVCEEWKNSFQTFYEWAMSNGYSDNLTIDRINNNGNYCPKNCRWVDMKTQQNNRRNNRKIIYEGKEYTLSKLAEKLNISSATLSWRLNNGWNEKELSIAPAFNNKVRRISK